ncbi:MAG: DNA repair protein RadA [Thermodesulfobacteriota bacterium]
MAKPRQVFRCSSCGAESLKWQGKCPRCGDWNTLVEESAPPPSSPSRPRPSASAASPASLASALAEESVCLSTGIPALDAALGGGLVPGQAVLLAGEPGIGKSTLLLQLAGNLARQGRTAVYVSAEESLSQIGGRAKRLGLPADAMSALATTRAEDALAALAPAAGDRPDLLVADSVQTMATDAAEGLPGSVSQVRAVAFALVEEAKRSGAVLVLVGHVTKDGQIAGPKLLEHMVDTVLSLEGDRRHHFRIFRVLKNRFGPGQEVLVLRMEAAGLSVVDDPSTFFLQDRDPSLPGAALVVAVDGQRPFAVEVQALAARTFLAMPRRTALGLDANRLHLLLAVLEKRLNLNFGQADIYAKIGAGLRLDDPGMDAGLAAAVLSSFYERPLPESAAIWGEVDLNGQIRPVSGHEARMKQAQRLGLSPILHPAASPGGPGSQPVATVADLQKALFGKR